MSDFFIAVIPDSPKAFHEAQQELARDLILKEKQIEYLIAHLPGINSSENDQIDRIKALQTELVSAEAERREALKERDEALQELDAAILRIKKP
jgi:mediator of RNA polymerase II transcription subunit 21